MTAMKELMKEALLEVFHEADVVPIKVDDLVYLANFAIAQGFYDESRYPDAIPMMARVATLLVNAGHKQFSRLERDLAARERT